HRWTPRRSAAPRSPGCGLRAGPAPTRRQGRRCRRRSPSPLLPPRPLPVIPAAKELARMHEHDQSGVDWRDGAVPVSRRFDDPYFSLNGGLAETRHVFLAGNDLPARLRPGFHVAETGFGTGLNLLALAQ